MSAERSLRLRLMLQNAVFLVLAVVLAGCLAWLAREHAVARDLTASGRNSLSEASREALAKLDGPIRVTAYATPQDARFGDLRRMIRDFMARYQRVRPDLTLDFVDPREQPKAAAQAGVKANGEMVVDHAGRTERLSTLSEFEFTNLLIRLSRARERLVMFLDGHGERSLTGGSDHDLGDFGRQLAAKGLAITALNLSIAPEVPDNAALLVIASPQVDLLPAEVARIRRHIERGGNLLWLMDAEPLRGLEPIAEALGLELPPGIVVDPEAIERGGRPVMAVAAAGAYTAHPITRAFRLNTVFPFARSVRASPAEEWRAVPLIEVAPRGWIESSGLEGRIVFDESTDVPGPITVAVALERMREERTQRIVVVGSGHFLANAYLGNAGNLDLGINMVNWLIGDDALIAVQPRSASDVRLSLSRSELLTIVIGHLVAAPLVLLAVGAWTWWRRRRA